MKGLCVSLSGDKAEFTVTGKKPEPGFFYSLEEYHNGTAAQNRFFHLLVSEYFNSGMHSYNADNLGHFRDLIKKEIGQGFELFLYTEIIDGKPRIKKVKLYEDVPQAIKDDPDMKDMIFGKLKSWSDYTKAQRTRTIKTLVAEMMEAGVNSKRFNEILLDMQSTEEKVKEIFQ